MNGPVLSIEAAIAGGSIAILSPMNGIQTNLSRSNVASADKLLIEISDLLDDFGLAPNKLGLVAVSLGPGSFTGIKIGVATAVGLAAALKIDCVGVTATEAMLEKSIVQAETLCAVPVARNLVCVHRFDTNQFEVSKPTVISYEEFKKEIGSDVQVIAHHQLVQDLGSKPIENLVDAGHDLAVVVGLRGLRTGTSTLSPVFASSHR